MEETPIIVNPNPVPAQAWVAVRSLLTVAGGFLVSRGFVSDAQLETLIGAVLILGPIIYTQFASRRNTAKLAVLAQAAPDTVAKVK